MATRKTEPRHEVDRDAGQEAREARLDDVVENPLDPTGGADGDGSNPWDQQLDDGPGFGHQGHPFGEQAGVEHDGASPVIEGDNPYTDPGVDLPGPDLTDLTGSDIGPEVETAPWLDAISPPGSLADPGGSGLPENNLDGANAAEGDGLGHGYMQNAAGEIVQIQPGDTVTTSVTKGGIIQTPQGDDEVTNEATGTETVTVPGEETAGGGEASGGEAGVPNVENDSWVEKAFQTFGGDTAEVERQAYKAARNAKIVADTKKEMEAKDKPADEPTDGNDSGSQPIDPEVDPETAAAMRQYGEAKSHYMQIKLDAEVSGDVNPDPGGTETGTVAGYDPKDYLEGDEPFQGAGGQEVPIDGAIDYGPDDTDHDPDSGLDDPLPGQGGPIGPDSGWTPPEEDEWTAEDEVDEMDLAPPEPEPEPEPSFEPDAFDPDPVTTDVADTGVDSLGI